MVYSWSSEVNKLSTHQWVRLKEFNLAISRLRFKSLSDKKDREQIQMIFETFSGCAPFSTVTRFPSDEIYVYVTHSIVAKHLSKLFIIYDKFHSKFDNPSDTNDYISNEEEHKRDYYDTISTLLDLMSNSDIDYAHTNGIFIRKTFEDYFKINWN